MYENCSRERSLMELLEEGSLNCPEKVLVTDGFVAVTYREAYRRACVFADYLGRRCGLDSSSTVLIALSNTLDVPVLVAACQAVGVRVGLVSSRIEKAGLEHAISVLQPQVVIVGQRRLCEEVHAIDASIKLMTVGCSVVAAVEVRSVLFPVEGYSSEAALREWSCDTDIVLFTTGSTGVPKAVVHRASSFFNNALKLTDALGFTRDDVLYLPVPIAHVYGFIGMYAALVRGAGMVITERYTPELSLLLLQVAHPTVYFGVPTMYIRELHARETIAAGGLSLRLGMVAGAPCPELVMGEYEQRFGCTLVQSYGITETAATLTVCDWKDPYAIRERSVGVPIPGVHVAIADDTGEILVQSPSLMRGILPDGEGAGDVLGSDGWLHTGDMGYLDEDGRLFVIGRLKDMIVRGGVNIYPAEVENIYQNHPGVDECCLVPYPDCELGQRTCLCVVLSGSNNDTPQQMRDYAKGRIEKCKLPDAVVQVDDFPRLRGGKIDRIAIRNAVEDLLGDDAALHRMACLAASWCTLSMDA